MRHHIAALLRLLADRVDPPPALPDRIFWTDFPAVPPSFFDALQAYERGTN